METSQSKQLLRVWCPKEKGLVTLKLRVGTSMQEKSGGHDETLFMDIFRNHDIKDNKSHKASKRSQKHK